MGHAHCGSPLWALAVPPQRTVPSGARQYAQRPHPAQEFEHFPSRFALQPFANSAIFLLRTAYTA